MRRIWRCCLLGGLPIVDEVQVDEKGVEYSRCVLLRAPSPQRLCYIYYSYSMLIEKILEVLLFLR
jgi:hypothetical protein